MTETMQISDDLLRDLFDKADRLAAIERNLKALEALESLQVAWYGSHSDPRIEAIRQALADTESPETECPVCEKGTLIPMQHSYCLNCGADPVTPTQIKRNEARLRQHGWPAKHCRHTQPGEGQ